MIQEYLQKMKKIQESLLNYINDKDDIEEKYQNLIQLLNDNQIRENPFDLKLFIHLLRQIGDNCHRTPNFFDKIEKILIFIKDETIKNFTNFEIFQLFKDNKRILLFLFNEKIITIDEKIVSIMTGGKFKEANYPAYFAPEINYFYTNQNQENSVDNDFYNKRKFGENDDPICELIRNDKLDDFISFIKQNNISPQSQIKPSIFETNPFLVKRENKNTHSYMMGKYQSLVNYAAFFGSIQIFKYLQKSSVQLHTEMLKYAIHGQNLEIINLIGNSFYEKSSIDYEECVKEAIKCHNSLIVDEINNIFSNENKSPKILSFGLKYYNFDYIESLLIKQSFAYLCKYDYVSIVNLLLKNGKIDVNSKIILFLIFNIILRHFAL